jgi:hypothetical protein
MPLCPNCSVEVDHLVHARSVIAYQAMIKAPDGTAHYLTEDKMFVPTPEKVVDEYDCPECSATLFHTEGEALAFLPAKVESLPYVR